MSFKGALQCLSKELHIRFLKELRSVFQRSSTVLATTLALHLRRFCDLAWIASSSAEEESSPLVPKRNISQARHWLPKTRIKGFKRDFYEFTVFMFFVRVAP